MLTEKNALNIWLKNTLPNCDLNLTKLAGDASFRKYYRVQFAEASQIVMDSSKDIHAFTTFQQISQELFAANLPAPQIFATDTQQAFALIEDFGDELLLDNINSQNADHLYKNTLDIILKIQSSTLNEISIPKFDQQHILKELGLLEEWFINKYLGIKLQKSEREVFNLAFNFICINLLDQPQKFTHMDYHSRNIIVQANGKLGIIDYQDARLAPYTYDLASILKDCYIQWPQENINNWLEYFYINSKVAQKYSKSEFIQTFDLCGLQRHLKVLGVFARLFIRDTKSAYLQDMPLVFNYILACLECYNDLQNFHEILREKVYPKFKYENSNDPGRGAR